MRTYNTTRNWQGQNSWHERSCRAPYASTFWKLRAWGVVICRFFYLAGNARGISTSAEPDPGWEKNKCTAQTLWSSHCLSFFVKKFDLQSIEWCPVNRVLLIFKRLCKTESVICGFTWLSSSQQKWRISSVKNKFEWVDCRCRPNLVSPM